VTCLPFPPFLTLCMLSLESTPLQHQHLQPFLKVLASLVQSQSPNKRDVSVQCLESLLARPECRRVVWAIPGIIAGRVIATPVSIQILSDGIGL